MSLSIQWIGVEQNNAVRVAGPGRYFAILRSSEDLIVKFVFEDEIVEQQIPLGIGIPFDEPFRECWITGTAAAPESVRILTHDRPIDDNRLSGQMDVDGLVTTQIQGGVTILSGQVQNRARAAVSHSVKAVQNISASTVVLPANTDRRSAIVQCNGNVFIGDSANGVKVKSITWDSESALTLVPETGTVEVRILEELNV